MGGGSVSEESDDGVGDGGIVNSDELSLKVGELSGGGMTTVFFARFFLGVELFFRGDFVRFFVAIVFFHSLIT